ncbi:MAG: hypothetical protein NTZ34_06575 [Chloroflexi bacterium]|nr:hypothetical protein [Chloroflexota bacterium]
MDIVSLIGLIAAIITIVTTCLCAIKRIKDQNRYRQLNSIREALAEYRENTLDFNPNHIALFDPHTASLEIKHRSLQKLKEFNHYIYITNKFELEIPTNTANLRATEEHISEYLNALLSDVPLVTTSIKRLADHCIYVESPASNKEYEKPNTEKANELYKILLINLPSDLKQFEQEFYEFQEEGLKDLETSRMDKINFRTSETIDLLFTIFKKNVFCIRLIKQVRAIFKIEV